MAVLDVGPQQVDQHVVRLGHLLAVQVDPLDRRVQVQVPGKEQQQLVSAQSCKIKCTFNICAQRQATMMNACKPTQHHHTSCCCSMHEHCMQTRSAACTMCMRTAHAPGPHLARNMACEASDSLSFARSLRPAARRSSSSPCALRPFRYAVAAASIVSRRCSHTASAGPRSSCRCLQ